MSKSRFTHEQILAILQEVDAGAGMEVVSKRYGISKATLYRWRTKVADRLPPVRERLQLLENENLRLKRRFAELSLDYTTLRAALISEGTEEC